MAGTDGDQHIFRLRFIAASGFVIGYRLTQSNRALIGGIVGLVAGDGRNGCGFDILRCVQIRLTDGEHGAVLRFPCHIGVAADGAAL